MFLQTFLNEIHPEVPRLDFKHHDSLGYQFYTRSSSTSTSMDLHSPQCEFIPLHGTRALHEWLTSQQLVLFIYFEFYAYHVVITRT